MKGEGKRRRQPKTKQGETKVQRVRSGEVGEVREVEKEERMKIEWRKEKEKST